MHKGDAGAHCHIQRRGSRAMCTTKRTSSYTFRGGRQIQCRPVHRDQPAHTQRMVQLPEVYPRTVRPTVRTPRAQNADAKRGTRDNAVRAASRGVHARATTTRCAEPTTASSPAASIGERTTALSTNFVYLDTLMMTS